MEGQMERVRNAVDGSEKKDGQETPAKGEGERDRELAKDIRLNEIQRLQR
jgi:hypothetical protein